MIIHCSMIKPGVRFSEPVYFEDGKNMFLGAGKSAKAFHVSALKRWDIPFLVTAGTLLTSTKTRKSSLRAIISISPVLIL